MTVLRSGSATDVGRVRTVNQDMVLERPNLYAVADGMGGHVGGEVAARVAVETLGHVFERTPSVEGLRGAFSEANAAVWDESQSNLDLRGMGTTLTAMGLVAGPDGRDVLALANVGDSRAYVYSDGELLQVTDDHSVAEERMRHGEMTEAEAAVHPQRHILTRVIGVFSEVEADMWELELHAGDRVLLCSDGLSNEVDTDDIAGILGSVDDPQEAADRLVEEANEHGGSDNVTVVIVDVQVGEAGSGGTARVQPLEFRNAAASVSAAAAGAAAAAANGGAEAAAAPDAPEPAAAAEPGSMADPAAQTAAVPAVRPDDTLAPGARLDFGDEPLALAETGPRSDEFFLGAATSVPVARATARVPPVSPPRTGTDRPPEKESRGARRRRLGIPRRITFRVVGFVFLVAAVPVAAYFVLKWYAYDNWIVTVQGDQIVVQQGQRGGVLWFHPRVVDRTPYTTSDITPAAVAPVRAGVQKSSLANAKGYVTSITTTTTIPVTTTTTTTSPFGTHAVAPSPLTASTTTTTTAGFP
jgi:serine/threonine protein phosphatase PrpC